MLRFKKKPPAEWMPTGLAGALRDPEPPLRYRAADRWADAWAGRRDGRTDAALLGDERVVGAGATLCAAVWLARNEHTFAERDRREFLDAQAAAAPMMVRLRALIGAAERAEVAAAAARRSLAGMTTQPSADALAHRGPGEVHDTADAVAARRRAAHQRVVAAADAAAAAAEQRVVALLEQVAAVRADLESLFEITRTRSDRLRRHHERRASTFLRAHRRTVTRRLGSTHTLSDHVTDAIRAPRWTDQPCPWTGRVTGAQPAVA